MRRYVTVLAAGMGYVLFLTKHHNGFCLWDTRTTKYGPIEFFWMDCAQGNGGLDRKQITAWVKLFQPGCFVGFNGGGWKELARGTTIAGEKESKFQPVTARYVRLNILKATEVPTIEEFDLYPPSPARL
jgi:alpha-L-fucosidase